MISVREKYDIIIEPIRNILRDNIYILYECPGDWMHIHTLVTKMCNSVIIELLSGDNNYCYYNPIQRHEGELIIVIDEVKTLTYLYIDKDNVEKIDFKLDPYSLLSLKEKYYLYRKTNDFIETSVNGDLTLYEFEYLVSKFGDRIRRYIEESTVYKRNEAINDILG